MVDIYSRKFKIYRQFEDELRVKRDSLEFLFIEGTKNLAEAERIQTEGRERARKEAEARGAKGLSIPWGIFNAVEIAKASRAIYAGALFLTLDGWIENLARNLGREKTERIEARYGFGGTIHTGANNMRHFSTWDRESKANRLSFDELESMGVRRPFNRILCDEILEKLGYRTYECLEGEVFALGYELAKLPTKQ